MYIVHFQYDQTKEDALTVNKIFENIYNIIILINHLFLLLN